MYNPYIGDSDYTQREVVVVPFAVHNQNILNLNAAFPAGMETLHQSCGYADYIDKYLTFPASGEQPPVFFNYTSEASCDLWTLIDNALFAVNPCFDVYVITQMCPVSWEFLGAPTQLIYTPPGADVYFDRTDVKQGQLIKLVSIGRPIAYLLVSYLRSAKRLYGSALQAACMAGHDTIVQTLLEHHTDVNAQGGHFGNALHAASAEGHDTIVQMLLEHHADANAQGGYFSNALHAASAEGHDKMLQMLLEQIIDVNAEADGLGYALEAFFSTKTTSQYRCYLTGEHNSLLRRSFASSPLISPHYFRTRHLIYR